MSIVNHWTNCPPHRSCPAHQLLKLRPEPRFSSSGTDGCLSLHVPAIVVHHGRCLTRTATLHGLIYSSTVVKSRDGLAAVTTRASQAISQALQPGGSGDVEQGHANPISTRPYFTIVYDSEVFDSRGSVVDTSTLSKK